MAPEAAPEGGEMPGRARAARASADGPSGGDVDVHFGKLRSAGAPAATI